MGKVYFRESMDWNTFHNGLDMTTWSRGSERNVHWRPLVDAESIGVRHKFYWNVIKSWTKFPNRRVIYSGVDFIMGQTY